MPFLPTTTVIFCVRISMTSLANMDTRKMCWRMSGSVKIGIFLVPSSAPAPGNGAHVWIFFEQSLPASKARRLGNTILTEAMERYGRMTFKSYDRFFPNQDRLPEGGFGNLVALPLQGKARKEGNSVFVNENFYSLRGPVGLSTSDKTDFRNND